jgi:hypothetical protein
MSWHLLSPPHLTQSTKYLLKLKGPCPLLPSLLVTYHSILLDRSLIGYSVTPPFSLGLWFKVIIVSTPGSILTLFFSSYRLLIFLSGILGVYMVSIVKYSGTISMRPWLFHSLPYLQSLADYRQYGLRTCDE